MVEFTHIPVMLNEVLEGLNLKPNGVYVDCTLGGAGHSREILAKTKSATLVGIDKDPEALKVSAERLRGYGNRVKLVHADFKNIDNILNNLHIDKVDGILADLGVSSYQLDASSRGFTFRQDAPLDMRMDTTAKLDAKAVVNTYSQEKLKQVIKDYGEEKFAASIAKNIVKARQNGEINTTGQLKQIILSSVPRYKGQDGSSNVQRTFQAIRIEVNAELDGLKDFIIAATGRLQPGGRLAIITFHSLEDRIVKHTFKELSTGCICPPDFPICVCGHTAKATIVGKMQTATELELKQNSRSSSAKLRILQKI